MANKNILNRKLSLKILFDSMSSQLPAVKAPRHIRRRRAAPATAAQRWRWAAAASHRWWESMETAVTMLSSASTALGRAEWRAFEWRHLPRALIALTSPWPHPALAPLRLHRSARLPSLELTIFPSRDFDSLVRVFILGV